LDKYESGSGMRVVGCTRWLHKSEVKQACELVGDGKWLLAATPNWKRLLELRRRFSHSSFERYRKDSLFGSRALQKNHIRSDPGCLDANVEGVEDGHGDDASSSAADDADAAWYTDVRCGGAALASTLETSDDDDEHDDVTTYSLSR
jgi:hypothetical protein